MCQRKNATEKCTPVQFHLTSTDDVQKSITGTQIHRLALIRDLWELKWHQQTATLVTHHNAIIYEKVDSVSGKKQKHSSEKHRETTKRVHTIIRIKIQQVPLNLTCSECNTTDCRSKMTGLRQLNNVSWLITDKPRIQQLSLHRRIWNKRTTRRKKRRNIWLRTKDVTF